MKYAMNLLLTTNLLAQIRKMMGGRAAEDLVFDRFTTGAANDLKQATDMARAMVCSGVMVFCKTPQR